MSHPAFKLLQTSPIESLNLTLEHYEHINTGAHHYHLACDNPENVFLVGLKTVPTDSKGVAHILEHTALCGSKKYPVRDPFFMMIRRSLNTFMNAFTSSDWTAYPFASENKKDFNNLMDVYLDAVFFSRLDELDFMQEGHRVEFSEEGNPESDLEFKGIVFNEMKGAMSSPVSQLWQTLTKYIFPTSTYHFNSGGEPSDIVDLTYQELKDFYKVHYHPTNAIFMTFGDIDAQTHQAKFEEQALKHFERNPIAIDVSLEKRYPSPIRVQESYPCEDEDLSDKTHMVMSWLLGESDNTFKQLEAHLLADVLLDNSASPLRKALEETKLAQSPSNLCGLEDSNREMLFACGIEGTNSEHVTEFENLVLDELKAVVENGVDIEKVEAVLHQLELSQREVSGDGYPYGLQIIQSSLSVAVHGGDVLNHLDIDDALKQLRINIQDPKYIPSLITSLLIDNPHRVTLTLIPDANMSDQKQALEKAQLQKIQDALTDADKQNIIKKTAELKDRQEQEDDMGCLPKVGLEDVSADIKLSPEFIKEGGLIRYNQPTNGLIYVQKVFPISGLSIDQLENMPLMCALITELGAGEFDYLSMQEKESAVTGGVHCFTQYKCDLHDESKIQGYLFFTGKALNENQKALVDVMQLFINTPCFTEYDRVKELMAQIVSRKVQSIVSSGHSLAMSHCASYYTPMARLSNHLGGLESVQRVKKLESDIKKDESALIALCETLASLHRHICVEISSELKTQGWVQVGEAEKLDSQIADLKSVSNFSEKGDVSLASNIDIQLEKEPKDIAWVTNSQVAFCAMAFKTVLGDHEDAPALTVLSSVLRNGFLHRAIREQGGAYGGGASQDSAKAVFEFYSYRDPRLAQTYEDFANSITWVLEHDIQFDAIEEAILSVVSSLDKPNSPAGGAKQDYQNTLFGRDDEYRQRFRQRLLNVSIADIKRVAKTYLSGDVKVIKSCVIGHAHLEEAKSMQFEIEEV
ncbi:insulinase family protein [Marinicellulosiphila megalodicopiae]|uniref:insulinase family protein n=1 Tax=Marinicellulosiphila megalodicopiae TaxID=2724896 RepID=UPI003BAEA7AC